MKVCLLLCQWANLAGKSTGALSKMQRVVSVMPHYTRARSVLLQSGRAELSLVKPGEQQMAETENRGETGKHISAFKSPRPLLF